MSIIATLEDRMYLEYNRHKKFNLRFEKNLVEQHYDWIKLNISNGAIHGHGSLYVKGNKYEVFLDYNPGRFRFDRIFIKGIKYHPKIHLYQDGSLCLYHPKFDRSPFRIIPLVTMIPWIIEWCVHYEEWKKYRVWLGDEIKH